MEMIREHEDRIGNYIIVVTEFRILFIDYTSYRVREIRPGALFGEHRTSIHCIEFVNNLVLFGCGDGAIFTWDVRKWKPAKRLIGGHSKAITSMIPFVPVCIDCLL
jgi:hypothetical protein